jgi:hypothetical protein
MRQDHGSHVFASLLYSAALIASSFHTLIENRLESNDFDPIFPRWVALTTMVSERIVLVDDWYGTTPKSPAQVLNAHLKNTQRI